MPGAKWSIRGAYRSVYGNLARSEEATPFSSENEIQKNKDPSWQPTTRYGAIAVAVVLAANIGIFAWVRARFDMEDGVATLYEGSCTTTKHVTLWVAFAVTALSTILLQVSSNAVQLLSAPTRLEVDKAHSKGKWLDIGIASTRNLTEIPLWRAILCIILLGSSVPLHLFYNSVVFSAVSANDYEVALVEEGFLTGGWWNRTRASDLLNVSLASTALSELQSMQKNVGGLVRLENEECLQDYVLANFATGWRNVLVVASSLTLDDSLLNVWHHEPTDPPSDLLWVCYAGSDPEAHNCDASTISLNPWSITLQPAQVCDSNGDECNPNETIEPGSTANVEYCLAESFPGHCRVQISSTILAVVIACNVLKLASLLTVLRTKDFYPLATVGDAIASFMTDRDLATTGAGALSVHDVRSGKSRTVDEHGYCIPRAYVESKNRVWGQGVSLGRWLVCIPFCLATWAAGIVLILASLGRFAKQHLAGTAYNLARNAGFGSINIRDLVAVTLNDSLVANILLANTPQLLLSIIYVLYTDILTCMLLSHEWTRYAKVRKPLRVSEKEGEQRSTHFLTVPYRYALPHMAATGLLHWFVSRSIFLVQITVYDIKGAEVPDRSINACGYSSWAIVAALCLGGAMLISLPWRARLYDLESGIPIARSCSLAIAAACHEGDHAQALLPLQYGEIPRLGGQGPSRVGFSAQEVDPLVPGKIYGGHRTPPGNDTLV